jgi:CRISPR-associated protein Csb2
VEIGELARAALQSRHGRLHDGAASPVFSGKDEKGSPLQGHAHAHYLPIDADGDGRIETLVVYAPCGFGPAERTTLTSIRRLRRRGDPYPMTCIMLGLGDRSGLGAVPALSEHRLWRSVTPFLLTRHPKKDGRDQPLGQLRLEIARRGMPEPSIVQYVPWLTVKGRRTRWIEFRRWRRHGSSSPLGIGFGFEIEFEEPVRGPIALGYGSHFGLGLFLPKNRSDA